MSYRKSFKLICAFAGGSAAVVFAAAAADLRGYFGERKSETGVRLSRLSVLEAAQPAWTAASITPLPTGHAWDANWDKRDPSTLSNGKKKESTTEDPSSEQDNGKPKATRNILLIRHSQYNLSGSSDKERILTPLGREQAELTGHRLSALGLKYDVLIHSSMARATETAHIISKHLPGVELLSCDLLREGAPIEPVPPVTHWKPDAVQYHEDGARIEAAFRRYIHRAEPKQKEDSYEIIVCHANVIRYFVCRALQFPPEGWLRMGLNNGSITWLTIRPSGRVALRTLGDAGFMPPDKLTRT
ncbi:serine/threonine-protein phosphatase PGAM5, mitochondrial isoform X1 [Corythoichthys intestinalis]|uniref:serine/threonine-protein phosphatase PGAM5, mitochondrial isoform X1 n=1 Tax=Corythoichthys intestinalis TaxID=161448 RepID=UPI0025A5DF3F|nr:serine/threonine-protein phosphatase PGAM5, mitochondrial isoform X1 [Corythoichthys intestinalis]XP_061804711.1 serine/threonine-protein phosphatase PGAM5, mitochondrial-like isoform X1 [Nerophis lumbriciformis]